MSHGPVLPWARPSRRDRLLSRKDTARPALTCMCMHYHNSLMRTTVEIPDEIRAKLLELAARRGERGFSALVEEALERYLRDEERRVRKAEEARSVLGTLPEDEARHLEEAVRTLRKGPWR